MALFRQKLLLLCDFIPHKNISHQYAKRKNLIDAHICVHIHCSSSLVFILEGLFISSLWVGQSAEPWYFYRGIEDHAVVCGHYNSNKGVLVGVEPFNMRQDVSWECNPM